MKKVLIHIVAIVAIVTLAACNSNTTNNEESAAPVIEEVIETQPPVQPEEKPTPAVTPSKPDTIKEVEHTEAPLLTTHQIIAHAKSSIDNNDYKAAAHALCLIDTTRMQEIFDTTPELASEIKFIYYAIIFSEDDDAEETLEEWDKMMTATFGLRLTDGNY